MTSSTRCRYLTIDTNGCSCGPDDTVWNCVIPYLQDPRDRAAVSLVCKRWYGTDGMTRKHVKMVFCYAATPQQLSRRFPQLESLKLKGKPPAAVFNLIDEDWGGYVRPWVDEVMRSYRKMKALHFKRMTVSDRDLESLATSEVGKGLEVLKLHSCSGFSTDGLLHIGRLCRNLRTLYMEESQIVEKDGEWLHQLALNNTLLENLNFYRTDLNRVRSKDFELLAIRHRSLATLKISSYDISKLVGFLRAAASLVEFAGAYFPLPYEPIGENVSTELLEEYLSVSFPPKLCQLGLTYLEREEMPSIYPISLKLKKLDLLHCRLDAEDHCQLLQRCPNLEVLETTYHIGNRGLEVVARFCKSMKRLRIQHQFVENIDSRITQRGLIAVAQGCLQLEYLAVDVSDITNEALECIGTYLKNLQDFRMVLLDEERITDLPLDNGVRSLLIGCDKLRRLGLFLRCGGLTNVGLSYIGQYSLNVRWMLLGCVGESDEGLIALSKGCPSLRKLEIRSCCFSERALAIAAVQITSLRYLWMQTYNCVTNGRDLMGMVRPNWNIELIPYRPNIEREARDDSAHIVAYYSLAGQRSDFPPTVVPFDPTAFTQSD